MKKRSKANKKKGLGRGLKRIQKNEPRLKDIGSIRRLPVASKGVAAGGRRSTPHEISAVYFTESQDSTVVLSLVAKTFQEQTVSLSRRTMLFGSLTGLILLVIREILSRRVAAITFWILTKQGRIQALYKGLIKSWSCGDQKHTHMRWRR